MIIEPWPWLSANPWIEEPLMPTDTSAQDAASQEAEARGWDVLPALEVEWARYDALPVGDSDDRQLVRTRIVQLLLHAWEPSIRASERERYAALVPSLERALGIIEHGAAMVGPDVYEFTKDEVIDEAATAIRAALAALEEAGSE